MEILSSIRYLARRRLPLRSHNDSESNFRQLDDPNFQEWLHKETNRFTSSAIQNEILKDMAMHILRPIVKNIKKSSYYSIMADETTDIINKEQFVICIRWVDNDLNANEDFIGLHELSVTNAETLAFILKDVVLRLGLDPERLRGQCYDGCSTMMGKKSGVATTIKNELNRNALVIHCRHAHASNLACADSIKNCKLMQNALETFLQISKLVKKSPKRESQLITIHTKGLFTGNDEQNKTKTIGDFSDTRWTVRCGALASIIQHYKQLK